MVAPPLPVAAAEAAEVPAPPGPLSRLDSLDAFRGFIMFWIVGGSALVSRSGISDTIVQQLRHTDWQGLRFYDLIWPAFMLMTGMSLPFSYAKRSLHQTHREILWRVLRRCVVLFLLGSLRESIKLNAPYLIELSSALQPIAIAYFAAFLLVRKSWQVQAAVGALLLVGYGLALAPFGYARGANLVYYTDMAVLGRVLPEGWGTVISTIPTISTTILGLLLGRLLMSPRPAGEKMRVIAVVGLGGVALGAALNPVVPVIQKLWTTSYGLASAGCSCLMFLFFYWVIDVRGFRRWAFPFVVIGMNAVAIYMAGSLIPLRRIVGIFTPGPLSQAIAVLVVEWLILYWMYRRKIFLTG
jgi:predicted acyltransferase